MKPQSPFKTDDESYSEGDCGCWLASQFLGRQSHCITLNEDKDIDLSNSCPFAECQLKIGRQGGGYNAKIKKLTQLSMTVK